MMNLSAPSLLFYVMLKKIPLSSLTHKVIRSSAVIEFIQYVSNSNDRMLTDVLKSLKIAYKLTKANQKTFFENNS